MIKINKIISVRGGKRAYVDCNICGKEFAMRCAKLEKTKESVHCSRKCYSVYMSKIASKRVIKGFLDNNRNMKSGCGITTDGYIWIYKKGAFNNQIKLHRYFMEIKLGRHLKSNEIVHHIDENKLNNTIENLELTTISQHNRIHGKFRAENRLDKYSKKEKEDLLRMSTKNFIKKYPSRTSGGADMKRSRLKKGIDIMPPIGE